MNKESDSDWFRIESNPQGTRWHGKCWYVHNYVRHEFDVQFQVRCCSFVACLPACLPACLLADDRPDRCTRPVGDR